MKGVDTMEWTKVSDRLPKKSMHVIVTINEGIERRCYGDYYYDADIKTFVDLGHFECYYNVFDGVSGVIAWMPLPKPYNGN